MLQACIDQGKTIEETRNILRISRSYDGRNIITGLFTASRQIEPMYDARCTTVLRQLTQMNLLRKEDVQQYALLNKFLQGSCPMVDQRQRFDFLVQLDPYALITQSDPDGLLPINEPVHPLSVDWDDIRLHDLPLRACASPSFSFIANFEIVFEAMIRYFPKMKGICSLFQTSFAITGERSSPFKAACDQMNARANPLVRAMVDDQIPLDTLYYVLRGSPDMLQAACDPETYGRDIITGVVEKVLSFSQSVKFLKHMKKRLRNFTIYFYLSEYV